MRILSPFVGLLPWSMRIWEHLWGPPARWHQCVCDHRVKCRGEQLGDVLPWRVPEPSTGVWHLLGRPV